MSKMTGEDAAEIAVGLGVVTMGCLAILIKLALLAAVAAAIYKYLL